MAVRGDQLIDRIFGQNQASPLHFLRDLVGMKLKPDRTGDACFGLRIRPVGDQSTIHDMANAISDGEDFHTIPVVLHSSCLSNPQRIFEHAVATKQVVVSVSGGIHHQMPLIGEWPFFFLNRFAPE